MITNNAKELLDLDATAQADLVRRGEVLATELVQASIDAVERIDGQLDTILHKAFDQALEAAERPVDKDAPFCGVPMVFKDQEQAVAGIPFSFAAFPFLKDDPWIGDHDGNFAADMRRAGAIFLGRANCSLGAFLPTHDIEAHVMPRNPWNPDFSTGGSSSGSAAAVAARIVAIGHGGDGGGSIRMPASICGVVGMKPTRGRVSVGPDRSEVFHFGSAWSHEFAMTRTVRDTAAILAAAQGWRPGDSMPMTNLPPIPSRAEMATGPLRIGLTNTPFPVGADQVDRECATAAEATLAALEELGHHVEVVDTYRYDLTVEEWTYGPPLGAHFTQMARLMDRAAKLTGRTITEADVGPQMWACAEIGRNTQLIQQLEFSEVLQRHTLGFDEWWARSGLDVLVTPTIPMVPPPIRDYLPPPHGTFEIPADNPLAGIGVNGLLIPFTQLFNWTGQPAISLPLAESNGGLPIGVQLVAARMQDEVLLRLGYELEEAMPWSQRRPAVCASR
ncbi:MAG TPA: amidase [Mycobacteriales bacterium]|nr:amidase [Mycobacteriales bacterium]